MRKHANISANTPGPGHDRGALAELALLILTAIGHIALELCCSGMTGAADSLDQPQHIYNLCAVALWGVYLAIKTLRRRAMLAEWGFRKQGFTGSFRSGIPVCVVCAAVLVIAGIALGNWPLPREFWLTILLYPLWGLAQQFALQAMISTNIRKALPGLTNLSVILLTAMLFSAAHFPNFQLMFLTLPAGLIFTWLFTRYRNIWALGIMHGILGAAAYYLVLGENPGKELLDMLV